MTKAAVVQAGSVPFNPAAATAKAVSLIAECGQSGAELAVFPEAFIGGYPKGSSFGSVIGNRTEDGRRLFERYTKAAITIDGEEVSQLEAAAREHGIFVVIGVIERLANTL